MSDHWWISGIDKVEEHQEIEYEDIGVRVPPSGRVTHILLLKSHTGSETVIAIPQQIFRDPNRLSTEDELAEVANTIVAALNAATGKIEATKGRGTMQAGE